MYDEINRSIVKRKRKYDRGGKHMKKILKIVVCFIGIMISASTVSASKLEILSESEDYEKSLHLLMKLCLLQMEDLLRIRLRRE